MKEGLERWAEKTAAKRKQRSKTKKRTAKKTSPDDEKAVASPLIRALQCRIGNQADKEKIIAKPPVQLRQGLAFLRISNKIGIDRRASTAAQRAAKRHRHRAARRIA
eukprot:6214545-Pleurochrysis_carterae.AAC.3